MQINITHIDKSNAISHLNIPVFKYKDNRLWDKTRDNREMKPLCVKYKTYFNLCDYNNLRHISFCFRWNFRFVFSKRTFISLEIKLKILYNEIFIKIQN